MQSKILDFPYIGNFVNSISADIQKFGIQRAMENIVKRAKTKLLIKGLEEKTEKVLKQDSVLVVADHPALVDPIPLLAALPDRQDIYIILNVHFMNISREFDKHCIPVYIQHHFDLSSLKNFPWKIANGFLKMQEFTPEVEHQKNIKSIKVASDKISKGGLIVVFPGSRGTFLDGVWYTGIGYLLKGVKTKNPVYIIKATISGTSHFDFLRLMPFISKFLPPFTVIFSEPLDVRKLMKYHPKEITKILEKDYIQWKTKN